MSRTTLRSVNVNPFHTKFVRYLMKEVDPDDAAMRRAQIVAGIPIQTFAVDLAFMFLIMCTVAVEAMFFSVGMTGFGWCHSVSAIMLDINDVGEDDKLSLNYTLLEQKHLPLESISRAIMIDFGIVLVGALLTSNAIYESVRIKLYWGFLLLSIGVPFEIAIVWVTNLLAGTACDTKEFELRLYELIQDFAKGNETEAGIKAVTKLNALQTAISCCGVKGYADYNLTTSSNEFIAPPSSCCTPPWAQNLYCAQGIFDESFNGSEELIESRINSKGCLDVAEELCGSILYIFKDFFIILVILRLLFAIIEGVLIYFQVKSYKEMIENGLKPLEQANRIIREHDINYAKDLGEDPDEYLSSEPSREHVKPKPKLKERDPNKVVTEHYLEMLNKGTKNKRSNFKDQLQEYEHKLHQQNEEERIRKEQQAAEEKRIAEELAAAEEEERLEQQKALEEAKKLAPVEITPKSEDKPKRKEKEKKPDDEAEKVKEPEQEVPQPLAEPTKPEEKERKRRKKSSKKQPEEEPKIEPIPSSPVPEPEPEVPSNDVAKKPKRKSTQKPKSKSKSLSDIPTEQEPEASPRQSDPRRSRSRRSREKKRRDKRRRSTRSQEPLVPSESEAKPRADKARRKRRRKSYETPPLSRSPSTLRAKEKPKRKKRVVVPKGFHSWRDFW